MREKTIAESLDGLLFNAYKGSLVFEATRAEFTFPDGSKARTITTFVDCEPFMEMGVTKSKKEIKHWKVLL